MTKVKKSFFERLTGSKSLEDEITEEQNISAPVFSEEREEMIMKKEPAVFRQPEEKWPAGNSDAEGQLTIDVYQTESEIIVKSTIAGVKPEDLDVSINNDMLTIRGERKNEEAASGENYYYQECYWGQFSRSVVLPVDVIPEKIEASLKNGILTVRLPKADVTKIKKIPVRGF